MKLRNIFVAVTVTLVAIAIAAPAGAQIKCKAKQNKKTGEIGYSFVNKAGGTVVYSYSDLDPSPGRPHYTGWGSFANENTCQAGGKGRNCLVSNDPAEAAIAPSSCKIYMADLTSGDKCELYVKGCQPAVRPLPTSGYYCIENNHETTAVWDAATGRSWHISSDHQPRSLDDHHEHLQHLNGTHVDPADTDHTPLVPGGDLELPTLHQLKHLAQDCADLFDEIGGVAGTPNEDQECLHTLCLEVWPAPTDPENCAWSRTYDATQPSTHAHAVCLVDTGGVSRARDCFGSICADASPREVGQGDNEATELPPGDFTVVIIADHFPVLNYTVLARKGQQIYT